MKDLLSHFQISLSKYTHHNNSTPNSYIQSEMTVFCFILFSSYKISKITIIFTTRTTMYFWIIGEHEELVQYALSYLHATDIVFLKKHIITFNTTLPERLQTCASLIKRGRVVSESDFWEQEISDTLGVADKTLGAKLKKNHNSIKRFKIVELIHTDVEIKESGTEVIEIDKNTYGIVNGYQNISLYETIDFHKPIWGMGIGMMPSKLALTLINIGIGQYETLTSSTQNSQVTLRDPFCGFGTTNFLANHLWYNTIWSDINPTQAKQNRKRRSTLWTLQTLWTLWTFLKHDVTQPFKSPIFRHGNIIVSEGRLGHIVTHKTALNEVQLFSKEVETVYKSFFTNLTALKKTDTNNKTMTVVITIPTWLKHNLSISETIKDHITTLWRITRLIEQPYSREKQLVGRQVLIARFWD